MSHPYKVHEVISRDDLALLEDFTREPGRTVDEVHEWMSAHGYVISRSAAYTWRKSFLMNDSYRQSAQLARSLTDATAGKDVAAISDAGLLQLSQIVFEASLTLQQDGRLEPKDVCNLSAALKNVITSKRHLEKLAEEVAERQKLAAAEAAKVAKAGGSADAVVAKVREILGVRA